MAVLTPKLAVGGNIQNFQCVMTLKPTKTFSFDILNSVPPVNAIFPKNNCRPRPLSPNGINLCASNVLHHL